MPCYRDALSIIIIQEFKDYIANVKKGFIDLIVSLFLPREERQTDRRSRESSEGRREIFYTLSAFH